MASWQARIYAVPSNPQGGGWESWDELATLRIELDQLFQTPEIKDFLDAQYWGDNERHDARLWLDEPDSPLFIRIDLREPVASFLEGLSRVLFKCKLLLKDGSNLTEPSEENLVRLIAASRAARFIGYSKACMDELA